MIDWLKVVGGTVSPDERHLGQSKVGICPCETLRGSEGASKPHAERPIAHVSRESSHVTHILSLIEAKGKARWPEAAILAQESRVGSEVHETHREIGVVHHVCVVAQAEIEALGRSVGGVRGAKSSVAVESEGRVEEWVAGVCILNFVVNRVGVRLEIDVPLTLPETQCCEHSEAETRQINHLITPQ